MAALTRSSELASSNAISSVQLNAAQLAAVPSYRLELGEPWDVAKIYWVTMSLSRVEADLVFLDGPAEADDIGHPRRGA